MCTGVLSSSQTLEWEASDLKCCNCVRWFIQVSQTLIFFFLMRSFCILSEWRTHLSPSGLLISFSSKDETWLSRKFSLLFFLKAVGRGIPIYLFTLDIIFLASPSEVELGIREPTVRSEGQSQQVCLRKTVSSLFQAAGMPECNLCQSETREHGPEEAEHTEVSWGFSVPQTLDHSACPLTINDLRGRSCPSQSQVPTIHWPAGSGPYHSKPWQETAEAMHIVGYYASIWLTFLTNCLTILVC